MRDGNHSNQMNKHSIIGFLITLLLIFCGCSTHRRVDGWYPIADYPDNSVIGKPLVTVKDFDKITILKDTFIIEGDTVVQFLIQGRVKSEKRKQWADGTEQLIGKRLGFIFNDSVITAPKINARIESGNFQITSPDTVQLKSIFSDLEAISGPTSSQ